MDARAAKLALARQKLKSHQEKKSIFTPKNEASDFYDGTQNQQPAIEHDKNVSGEIFAKETTEISYDSSYSTQENQFNNSQEVDLNITEILIASKRNLESQITELQSKLSQVENDYAIATDNISRSKQQISNLECELQILQDQSQKSLEEISKKEKIISDLKNKQLTVCDENNNLQEQLEFTKSMLTSKETENLSLQNHLTNVQTQLDAVQLQLQQITSGAQTLPENNNKHHENTEVLLQKITNLEHQLKAMHKEREQMNSHYEQYVSDLNKQLKISLNRNNELSIQVQNLSTRESNLIEQISEQEIRIQNIRQQQPLQNVEKINQDVQAKYSAELKDLQQKYENIQAQLQEVSQKYLELQNKCAEAKEQEMNEKKTECDHDSISLSKLTADMASDKLAAQMATEQNKKLKLDLQELEEVFVKISRDKLELTEKVAAEKYLNRELTIKLAEIDENAKNLLTKLHAKDNEMIRLQNSYRELEMKIRNSSKDVKDPQENGENTIGLTHNSCIHGNVDSNIDQCHGDEHDHKETPKCTDLDNNPKTPKEHAMEKLQDRFLKIMDEVANLSDEKHRLEHIILQLQNETDTICEYVALYQQQRSLLKKRDEERSAQIKIFQAECELLKSQLEELSRIIIRLAQDTELSAFFQTEPRHSDLAKVMNLLTNLKNNTLVDPHKTSSDLKDFYPCSCCSGQLIEI